MDGCEKQTIRGKGGDSDKVPERGTARWVRKGREGGLTSDAGVRREWSRCLGPLPPFPQRLHYRCCLSLQVNTFRDSSVQALAEKPLPVVFLFK